MKRKTLVLILVIALLFTSTACVKRIDKEKKDENQTEVVEKKYEDMTLEEKLEYKASFEREYVASEDKGKIAPAKDSVSGQYGYINIYGDWVIEPSFSMAYSFSYDLAPVIDQYNEYEYILRDGSVFTHSYTKKASLKAARHFYDFYTALVLDTGFEQNKVYMAADGISQINAAKLPSVNGVKYESKQYFAVATPFLIGNAVVMRKTNSSLLETYERSKMESKGWYQSAYVIDFFGAVVAELPAGYDIFDYSLNTNGTIIVRDMTKESSLYGVCNLDGELIIPCKYNHIEYCDGDLFLASDENGFFGYLDKTGKIVIEFKYIDAYPFSEDLAVVREGDYWGVIDTKGNYLVKPFWANVEKLYITDFDFNVGAGAFAGGVAAVQYGDFWALIDESNNIIDSIYCPGAVNCPYSSYSDGLLVFEEYKDGMTTGKYGLIDTQGHLVLEAGFDSIGRFE